MNISIDFETYSECDIFKAGAFAYADHPTTEVLCLAWAVDDQPPQLWQPGEPPPALFFELIEQGATLWAWNSFFEMSIWSRVLEWPEVPLEQWRDTAALAAAQAYPRSLGKCGEVLGLTGDAAKSKRGKLLIQRLCKPYRGERRNDAELLKELYDYCLQDVVAEREIRYKLRPLNALEQEIWQADQRINWRGVRLDRDAIYNTINIIGQLSFKLNAQVKEITGGFMDSTGSRAKAMQWTASQGYFLPSYDKPAIAEAVADKDCPANVKKFLEIRQALSKSSTKKYDAMKTVLARDGRARGVLMYHGAATGRWTGRHFQPQNLPRPTIDNVDAVIAQLKHRDPDVIEGEPMGALASCLRGMLIASKGNRLMVSDYSSIEALVLAWLAFHDAVLKIFRDGKDIYKFTAAEMYGIAYAAVDYDQRFVGKVATLALGFQGGVRAFLKMAKNHGIEFTEEQALKIRNDWRVANAPIVNLWVATERAARNAVSYQGKEFPAARGRFKFMNGDLLFKLPSGRILSFPEAKMTQGDRGMDLVYSGMDNHIHKWGEIKAYGGSLVQSITEGVGRDILADAIVRLEKEGYPVVLHVHDEIIADVPKKFGTLKDFEKIMCQLPAWAEGLPVVAEGYEAQRYRK